jgi:hypothetical protein
VRETVPVWAEWYPEPFSATTEGEIWILKRAAHPGEILKDELDEFDITPTELARQLDVPANRIGQIIASKRAITGDTALRLGH